MSIGREQLKPYYFFLQRMLGRERRMMENIRRSRLVVVLNLHSVRLEPSPYAGPLHPALFEELLRFIVPRFRVTTFEHLKHADGPLPPMVLSFDDGFYDFLEYAAPLLRKYNLPCNQNVITNSVLSGQPPATVRLSDFLNQAPRALVDSIQVPGFNRRLREDSVPERIRFANALSRFLKLRPSAEAAPLWEAVERVIAQFDHFRPSRMMNAAEVRQAASEHEIGAHSTSHDSMEFESDATFERDFESCETLFREELKLLLRVYAFPNGSWRPSLVQILRQRGIEHALLTGDKYASLDSDTYPRFTFFASSRGELRFRALGWTAQ